MSSETAGRLLGIATKTPTVVEVIEDLLTPDEDIRSPNVRWIRPRRAARKHTKDIVLGVVREGVLYRVDNSRWNRSRWAIACCTCGRRPIR